MVVIQDRASWEAKPPANPPTLTTPVELYLHHSVGSGMVDKDGDNDRGDDYMRSMQALHTSPPRNWNDIAYNHAHDPDGGEFYEGRGFGIRPGSQKAHNTGTHSLAVMGDFQTKAVTTQLKADIAGFYVDSIKAGLLPNVTVQGHKDAPNQATTCPGGNLYNALDDINQLIQEGLEGEMLPPSWATQATQWHIDNDIYTEGSVADVDEDLEFHRQTVFRHRLYQNVIAPSQGGGVSEADVKAIINDSQIVAS